ncbi:hypothetical protein GIB67_010680 [Kingdonia uniflora]|uniref:Calcineurin-like phosphoesterase domain-containing protein n=1 Tax=Kingdonia uniflora TaxID=39325 RepID=A0A7J7NF29_9MAGN|nr:hypothetical protein GIB67_010680 [Kingdonia uniflora]
MINVSMVVLGSLPILRCQSRYRKYYISDQYIQPQSYKMTHMKRRCTTQVISLPYDVDIDGEMSQGLRVFVLSDLHTDYSENMDWVKSLSTIRYRNDVLIVAGDVAETYNDFVFTMSLLKDRFEHVFYVPGNHDLWCRWEGDNYLDSIEKLNALLTACSGIGVKTSPAIIDGLGIIPLFSWYHESFDKEENITSVRFPSLEMVCKDFHACKWHGELSSKDLSLALYFDAMNKKNHDQIEEIQQICSQIITFSHFLPRQELCPEKRMLFYPNLPKIIGSDSLEARIRSIHGTDGNSTSCHVYTSPLSLSKRKKEKN